LISIFIESDIAFPSISLYVINIGFSGHEINEYTIIPIQNQTTFNIVQEIVAMLITGTDIIEIARIGKVFEKYGSRFLTRIYTEDEQKYCKGRAPQLASRFAAKEAVMKALGTGVRGIGWKDIEIRRERGGPPYIQLHGRAQARASKMNLSDISISLSHSNDFALATVVGEASSGNRIPR